MALLNTCMALIKFNWGYSSKYLFLTNILFRSNKIVLYATYLKSRGLCCSLLHCMSVRSQTYLMADKSAIQYGAVRTSASTDESQAPCYITLRIAPLRTSLFKQTNRINGFLQKLSLVMAACAYLLATDISKKCHSQIHVRS